MSHVPETRRVLITGVSSGIGLGLTRALLHQDVRVLGISRHAPDLRTPGQFQFVPCDLSYQKEISPAIKRLLADVPGLDLAILNAGILGPFGDLKTQSLDEMQRVMQVNLWANKVILDVLQELQIPIRQIVMMSSSAAIHLQRGWGGYAISKAALNALVHLAAPEWPQTHLCAFAPGPIDTSMQDQLCSLPPDPRYPSLDRLRARRGTAEMPDGDESAPALLEAIWRLPELVPTGSYVDIRTLPGNQNSTGAAGTG
jgi:NAD(P)-dependent dehydrogenase (short-subunit alcohol dehydrogenase family)